VIAERITRLRRVVREEKRNWVKWTKRGRVAELVDTVNDANCRELLDRIVSYAVPPIIDCRMRLHGNVKVWAYHLPLPVQLLKRRFDCYAQQHRDAVKELTRQTRHPFSAAISYCHPDFNASGIPATAVKTCDFWCFNQRIRRISLLIWYRKGW